MHCGFTVVTITQADAAAYQATANSMEFCAQGEHVAGAHAARRQPGADLSHGIGEPA